MPFAENLPDENGKLFTVLLQTLEARITDFPKQNKHSSGSKSNG